MSFDDLIADLESQMLAAERGEHRSLVRDMRDAELAQVRLSERLRAACGSRVVVTVMSGLVIEGHLARCGEGWVQVDAVATSYLVPHAAIRCLSGLRGAQSKNGLQLKLTVALRALRGRRIRCLTEGPSWVGRLREVGADWIELCEEGSGATLTIALSGLEAVVF